MMISSTHPASVADDKYPADVKDKMVSNNHINDPRKMEETKARFHQQNCDILLNNFQIKKKRYKVLLNCDHIVWERLDAKHSQRAKTAGNSQKSLSSVATVPISAATQKGIHSTIKVS